MCWKRVLGDQRGQAMVELGLILILVGPLLMALIIVYDLVDEMITVQESLRHELRQQVDRAAPGPFRRIEVNDVARVKVPGRMGGFLIGKDSIEVEMSLSSYGGCYQGLGLSEFAMFSRYREIRE